MTKLKVLGKIDLTQIQENKVRWPYFLNKRKGIRAFVFEDGVIRIGNLEILAQLGEIVSEEVTKENQNLFNDFVQDCIEKGVPAFYVPVNQYGRHIRCCLVQHPEVDGAYCPEYLPRGAEKPVLYKSIEVYVE